MRLKLDPSVPPGLSVALYKGTRPGLEGLYNRLGRFLDRGPYSHCELIFSNGQSASASYLDHGVRIKAIAYSSVGNWDFLPLPDPRGDLESAAGKWFGRNLGKSYDVWGNLRFASNFARDDADKWFCSEAVIAALGWPEPYRYGPSGMATALRHFFKVDTIVITAQPHDD